jgi:hypothetical protein
MSNDNIVRFQTRATIEENRRYDALYQQIMDAIDELAELCGSTPAMITGGVLVAVIERAPDMAQAICDANDALQINAGLSLVDDEA